MKPTDRQSKLEWIFLALLALLCAGLGVLQFRWTGDLGAAEQLRLQTSLNDQLRRIGNVFDTELRMNCNALMPSSVELEDLGADEAHAARLAKWNSGKPNHALFRRLAVVIPHGSDPKVFEMNSTTGALREIEWPQDWLALRARLGKRPPDRGAPFFVAAAASALVEFPIFDTGPDDRGRPPPEDSGGFPPERGPERRLPREHEWMIFEVNLDFITHSWLPALIKTHLNTAAAPDYDVEIRANDSANSLVFASSDSASRVSESADGSARFFAVELPWRRGRDDGGREDGNGRWTIFARHRAGSIEAAVTSARRRNLLVAVLLNGLIFVAGCALLRHTRRSRQLADAQMKFVANVSHELRTPLTVIRGAGHNLQRGIVREPVQIAQYAGLIVHHAEQLTSMVEQVLAFAGATRTESAAHHRPLALAQILRDSIATVASEIDAAQCRLEIEIAANLPPVQGDTEALQRAFQNLLLNAARHGGEGKWIGVAAAKHGADAVKIEIIDRGGGIPKNELEQIFHPFFRGAASEAKQIRGSGLGLSLVREIVEAHGGSISVQSESGRGSTFTVRLPVSPPASAS